VRVSDVVLESGSVLESDSSTYFEDSDSDSNPSAPVERAFSSAGMFMRPHRARLSNKMLSDLVFLKCNMDKL